MAAIPLRRQVYIRPVLPAGLKTPAPKRHRSLAHAIGLGLIWLAIASSSIVFTEPAPTDLLTMATIVLLPVLGLSVFRPRIVALGAGLLVITAFGFLASLHAGETGKATTHMAITLYLSLAALVIAGFVARRPERHTAVILSAHLAAALLAATLAMIGYFDILPGSSELFTKFDRASGAFKDPNVFGPFLIPAIVYALHVWMNRPLLAGLPWLAALALLGIALLVSFSRGAWAGAGLAVFTYLYLTFVTTRRNIDRLRIGALAAAGIAGLALLLLTALQFDEVGRLFAERATLDQTYDSGPEGRFGGQMKAIGVLIDNPWGIGALEFPRHFHHEDVHNVYLSMFLNAGWGGGLAHLLLAVVTIGLGVRHALRRTSTQGLFLVAFAALLATVLEGFVIDTDHWRHYYVLLGAVWGLMSVGTRDGRRARILSDRRPVLLRPVILLPPTRRQARIVGRSAEIIELRPQRPARRIGDFNRPARLVGRIAPHRPVRLLPRQAERIARLAHGGNDNMPPSTG